MNEIRQKKTPSAIFSPRDTASRTTYLTNYIVAVAILSNTWNIDTHW